MARTTLSLEPRRPGVHDQFVNSLRVTLPYDDYTYLRYGDLWHPAAWDSNGMWYSACGATAGADNVIVDGPCGVDQLDLCGTSGCAFDHESAQRAARPIRALCTCVTTINDPATSPSRLVETHHELDEIAKSFTIDAQNALVGLYSSARATITGRISDTAEVDVTLRERLSVAELCPHTCGFNGFGRVASLHSSRHAEAWELASIWADNPGAAEDRITERFAAAGAADPRPEARQVLAHANVHLDRFVGDTTTVAVGTHRGPAHRLSPVWPHVRTGIIAVAAVTVRVAADMELATGSGSIVTFGPVDDLDRFAEAAATVAAMWSRRPQVTNPTSMWEAAQRLAR